MALIAFGVVPNYLLSSRLSAVGVVLHLLPPFSYYVALISLFPGSRVLCHRRLVVVFAIYGADGVLIVVFPTPSSIIPPSLTLSLPQSHPDPGKAESGETELCFWYVVLFCAQGSETQLQGLLAVVFKCS